MWDQPTGAVPLMKDNEIFTLRRLERTIIIQSWLVAIKTGSFQTYSPSLDKLREQVIPKVVRESGPTVVPLASVPAFGSTFFADMDLPHFNHNFAGKTPDIKWGLSGFTGFFPATRIDRRISKTGPLPMPTPTLGSGGRFPVTIGVAGAIKPDEAWLSSLGFKL